MYILWHCTLCLTLVAVRSSSGEDGRTGGDRQDQPTAVMIAQLRREVLLTTAKLQGLMYDNLKGEGELRRFNFAR